MAHEIYLDDIGGQNVRQQSMEANSVLVWKPDVGEFVVASASDLESMGGILVHDMKNEGFVAPVSDLESMESQVMSAHETDMVSSDASSEDKELVFDSKKGYFVLVEKNR